MGLQTRVSLLPSILFLPFQHWPSSFSLQYTILKAKRLTRLTIGLHCVTMIGLKECFLANSRSSFRVLRMMTVPGGHSAPLTPISMGFENDRLVRISLSSEGGSVCRNGEISFNMQRLNISIYGEKKN